MKLIGRFFLWVLALLATMYVVLWALSRVWPVAQVEQPNFQDKPFIVIAHQGGDGLRPSNTMAAFHHAVELEVDVLEMDVHSTRDGVLVTIHDSTVDRTTNGSGAVIEFTYDELKNLDAGYHWPTLAEESHRTDRPYRGQDITIPKLEGVFEAFPNMPMNIEIKQKEPNIVIPFCDLLKKYNRTGPERTLVASFHQDTIEEFRTVCPDVPTAVVTDEVIEFYALNSLGLHRIWSPPALAFQIPQSRSGINLRSERLINNLQAHGVTIHYWTINETDDMKTLIEMGVDGIITDYPDKLLEISREAREERHE